MKRERERTGRPVRLRVPPRARSSFPPRAAAVAESSSPAPTSQTHPDSSSAHTHPHIETMRVSCCRGEEKRRGAAACLSDGDDGEGAHRIEGADDPAASAQHTHAPQQLPGGEEGLQRLPLVLERQIIKLLWRPVLKSHHITTMNTMRK